MLGTGLDYIVPYLQCLSWKKTCLQDVIDKVQAHHGPELDVNFFDVAFRFSGENVVKLKSSFKDATFYMLLSAVEHPLKFFNF